MIRWQCRLLAACLGAAVSSVARAAEYHVSVTGNDGNPGTLASPWRTVAKSTSVAAAGDTVYFGTGIYHERLVATRSGTAGSPVGFRARAGESPVLDGTGVPFNFDAGMVDIRNKSHLVIDGFEIRNLTTASSDRVPIGIYIHGDPFTGGTAPTNVVIENCRVHTIRNTHGSDGNAHGILAKGEIASPLSAIVIRNNEVYNNRLGFSEALAVNGNVDGFEVSGNSVHDNDNIGIDIIGFEGSLDPALDFARNGVVRDNLVYNCSSIGNPLYGEYSAGGIYVDGGALTVIERNRVYQCDIGIELASEHSGRSTRDIAVRDNILWRNALGGLFTGGYEPGLGSTNDCVVTHNTLFENDTLGDGTGEILIRDATNNLSLRNNLVVASPRNVFILKDSANTSGITMDYNVFFSPAGQSQSEWQWKTGGGGGFIEGFTAFRNASGTNAHSFWANPLFPLTTGPVGGFDFSLPSNSPARDAGDPAFSPAAGETDVDGNPRVSGARTDVGASEFTGTSSALEAWRDFYFGTTQNVGDAANDANPDTDSLANLLEFVLDGLDPTVPDSNDAMPDFDVGSREFAFRVRVGALDVTAVRVQAAEVPGDWIPIASHDPGGSWTVVPGVSVVPSGNRIVVRDQRPEPADGALFYRLTAFESP